MQQDNSNPSAEDVQLAANGEKSSSPSIQQVAATGFSGSSTSLPHLNQIQQSFGVDLSGVQAYIGGSAAAACQQMGAAAYASGNQIAFNSQPSLELAAHEAAHVVQQRSGKVQLAGGVGQVGDKYENHADAVAAKVASGKSAAPLLGEYAKPSQTTGQAKSSETVQGKSCQIEAKEPSSGDNEVFDSLPAKPQPANDLSEQRQPELMALRGLPPLPSVIPESVLRRAGGRVSQKVLWRRFWQVVIKRFAIRGAAAAGLSAADGPLPIGELIALGIAIWTLWDLFRLWNELWNQVPTEPQEQQTPVPTRPRRPSQEDIERSQQAQRRRPSPPTQTQTDKDDPCTTEGLKELKNCNSIKDKIVRKNMYPPNTPYGQYRYSGLPGQAADVALRSLVGRIKNNQGRIQGRIEITRSENSYVGIGLCPDGGGSHHEVRDEENNYVASIICCECCQKDPKTKEEKKSEFCAILPKRIVPDAGPGAPQGLVPPNPATTIAASKSGVYNQV